MSQSGYLPRHVISLGSEVSLARPKELPEMVRLDSPALAVAMHYKDLLRGWMIDTQDAHLAVQIEAALWKRTVSSAPRSA